MFTGQMSEEDMLHEHPLELADMKAGLIDRPIEPATLRKRQMVFLPFAAILTIFMLGGVYGFVNAEETALTTIERQVPTLEVFVPQTATPAPTQTPTLPPTETPLPSATATAGTPGAETATSSAPTSALTWDNSIGALFQAKCGTCHGAMASGGLNLSTYADTMRGGNSGPVIDPGDAAGSKLVQVQQTAHYGQFTPDELQQIIDWINAGALEK
jgi:mono/diheme cytochrome c family protein